MTAKREFWFLIFATQALFACSYHIPKNGAAQQEAPSLTRNQLSFAVVNQYVFQPKCVPCHGSSGNVNLESYSSVRAALSEIDHTIFTTGSMPKSPVPPLSDSQKKLVREWLDSGAPEFASGPDASPLPLPEEVPLEPKFASIKKNIFDKKCLICHSPGGKASSVPLDTIDDLLHGEDDLVVPGHPEQSYLITILTPGARRFMPPLKSGISRVTDAELKIIQEWIQNGAHE